MNIRTYSLKRFGNFNPPTDKIGRKAIAKIIRPIIISLLTEKRPNENWLLDIFVKVDSNNLVQISSQSLLSSAEIGRLIPDSQNV